MFDFIRYAVGTRSFLTSLIVLAPTLIRYQLGLLENWQAKEAVLRHFFGGWDYQELSAIAHVYSLQRIPRIVRPRAWAAIKKHQANGDTVVIVSASAEIWLQPWCTENHLDLISTKLEIRNGIITGRFNGLNCHGPEKARRIQQNYSLAAFETIYAYGDSSGDKEMLELAQVRFYNWKQF